MEMKFGFGFTATIKLIANFHCMLLLAAALHSIITDMPSKFKLTTTIKPKPTENFISIPSEIPNHSSTYSHKIHYKTKLFRHLTIKQYVNEH